MFVAFAVCFVWDTKPDFPSYMNDMIVKVRDTYLTHYGTMSEIVQGNEYIPMQGLHHKDTTIMAKGNHHL